MSWSKDKLVYGVGINDADYLVSPKDPITGKQTPCKFYDTWVGLLERCFSDKLKNKYPSYKDVTCCSEWLIFSNFKMWMETQYYQDLQLDKDILVKGNKVYSPETCVFIPTYINTLLLVNNRKRGSLLLGVSICKESKLNPYRAQVSQVLNNKNKHLGLFSNELSAHLAWQAGKAEQILIAGELYKDELSFRKDVYDALVNRSQWLLSCIAKGIIVDTL